MTVDTGKIRDEPWQRVGWTLPAALVVTAAALIAFLFLLAGTPTPPKPDKPVEMQIVELPPEAPPPPPEQPPPERQVEPDPPPPPLQDKLAIEPPPPPPKHIPRPRPKPRPEKPPEPRPQTPPPVTRPPPPPNVPVAPSNAPAGGGTMGARVLYQPKIEIPEALRHRKLAVMALARLHIGTDGGAQAELVEATSDPALNQAILDTLKKWRFFPAMAQGKPVPSVLDIKIPISVE